MSNNTTSEKLSFWQLIQKCKIEIPIIQRDYAQGREDKTEIRNSFLNTLHNALIKEKELELDFVYGSVKNDTLQPLDGQQRLTTLFLLHWYLLNKENETDEKSIEVLRKFTYETRISSRDFCEELVKRGINFKDLIENKISKTIIDSSWFFLSWQKDPTIKAMLIMLDEIHNKFYNSSNLLKKLTELNLITFQYIELRNFGLSDDLYIKMNARGKALTEFENFKAKFEQYIKSIILKKDENDDEVIENGKKVILKDNWEKDIEFSKTFSSKIDNSWTDLFWNYRNKNENSKDFNLFDKEFMNFFRVMATNHYAIKHSNSVDLESNIGNLLEKEKSFSFNDYEKLDCFDENYKKSVVNFLDKLSVDSTDNKKVKNYFIGTSYIDEDFFFKNTISNNLGYADLVVFYAYSQYLALEDTIDKIKLSEWMRVIRNLVEASRPHNFNNVNDYARIIKSISINLLPNRMDILNYLKGVNSKDISGFRKEDIDEEIEKAKLILESEYWKKAIIEIENHKYFKGQIGFLLDWCNKDGIYNLELFNEYVIKIKTVFGDFGLNKFGDFQFERALLAKGDYLLSKSRNYSFLLDNDRDISWKRLLRDNNDKRFFLKLLIDLINPVTIHKDLDSVIEEFEDKEDWKFNFIKQPELIKQCGSNKLIRWLGEKDILLLGSSTTSGYHSEYYSYSLFLNMELDKKGGLYYYQRSINEEKFFTIGQSGWWKEDWIYKISYQASKYKLVIHSDPGLNLEFDNQEQIIFELNNMKEYNELVQ